MAAKVLLLLACLIVHASCGQNSLTFVIDDTGSMYDDIKQVKNAAKSILDIVLNEKQSQIEDIVLVTFNDPGTILRKKTRDAQQLKHALDSIIVNGGGDCEEMSLSGIKKGLEESRPGSYIYVFTDASSKDFGKFEEIKRLCQDQQSQIVFVLTGHCNDVAKESYQVYHKIAQASSGQVFNIEKDEVGQVLEYVKETIKGDRTVIESTIVPPNTWRDVNFNIDEQTEYAVVSASGTNVVLHIIDPYSRLISGKSLTWTNNVKVLKLANLSPGTYKARVKGNSAVNIMIFGRTDFTFQHGFSTEAKNTLTATDTQPTTGVRTHLIVSVQDKRNSALVREVELRNMDNQVVMTLPLTLVAGNVYRTEKFLSPQNTFQIAVVATSKNTGATVKRVAKTPVTPIQSVRPVIDKTNTRIKIKEGASTNLYCRAQGRPKPQITWYMKKEHGTSFSQVRDTDGVVTVTNALTNDYYKCVAVNVVGNDEHIQQLDVQARPQFQNPHDTVVTKNEGEPVTIDCGLSKGNPRPKIIWQFKARGSSSYQNLRTNGEKLVIRSSELSNSGHYICSASNDEGNVRKSTELVVRAKPTLGKLDSDKSVMENATIDLHCSVTRGFPAPMVNWFYKGPNSADYGIISNNGNFHLDNVQLNNAGQYKCVAQNEVGRDERVVNVVVNAPPRIVFVPPNSAEYSGVVGDVAMRLPCDAIGYPTPAISWVVDKQDVGTDKSKELYVEGNSLFLLNPQTIHSTNKSHTYACRATNSFGQAVQPYTVDITGFIDAEKPNGTQHALSDQPFDLVCPLPFKDPSSVRWFKYSHYHNKTGPTLHFDKGSDLYNGNYTCRVSDLTGVASKTIEVIFGQPPKQDVTSSDAEWNGEEKKLDCYSRQIPVGKYEWFYNGQKLEKHSGSLNVQGWGEYTCRVSNPHGSLELKWKVTSQKNACGISKSFTEAENFPLILTMSSWPTIAKTGEYFIVPHSEKLELFCQDDKSSTNKLPTFKSIYAVCEKEDSFLVNGVSRKISELECKGSVPLSVVSTGQPCLGENTELKRVGFNVNGFTDVYQSCIDKIKNVPLYTKMTTIPVEKEKSGVGVMAKKSCSDKCCYEKIQLVNAEDVSFGPAKKGTFIDSLNSVNYCRPTNVNETNWHKIEDVAKEEIPLIVWSGAAQYTKVGEAWTPKYLWKVMKETERSEKVVIVHENAEPTGPQLCTGECGEQITWIEPAGKRTYCCSLADFKTAFDLNIKFD